MLGPLLGRGPHLAEGVPVDEVPVGLGGGDDVVRDPGHPRLLGAHLLAGGGAVYLPWAVVCCILLSMVFKTRPIVL